MDEAIDLLERHRQSVAENVTTLLLLASTYYDRALRDQDADPARALQDAGASLVCYEKVLAIGALPDATWIRERIEQLGHWIRWKDVGAPPGLPPDEPDGTENTGDDGNGAPPAQAPAQSDSGSGDGGR
jgi:hypothetical protein